MYDVIVVGGGPSGSTAAYHCARLGLKTLLLEKEKMPRPKICGGGFGLVFKNIPKAVKNIIKQQTKNLKIYIGKSKINIPVKLHMFERKDFDYALVKRAIKAGAKFKQEKVKSVVLGSLPQVKTNKRCYKTKIVIGADGVGSIVSRSTGLYKKIKYIVACEIEDKMPSDFKQRYGNSIVMFFDVSVLGYYWLFPKGDLLNIGVGYIPHNGKILNLQKLLFDFIDKYGIRIDRNKAKICPIPFEILPKVYRNNVLLVGDAAGFADPCTGSGIELGMISGKAAAEVAAEAIRKSDFSEKILHKYVDKCAFVYQFIKRGRKYVRFLIFISKSKLIHVLVRFKKTIIRKLLRLAATRKTLKDI